MREQGRLAARPTARRTALLLAAPLLALLVACSGSDTAEDPEAAAASAVTIGDIDGNWTEAGSDLSGKTDSAIWIRVDRSHLNASAGCNSFDGNVRVVDGRLEVDRLVSTAMGCADRRGQREAWLSSLLRASPTVSLDGGKLVLTTGDASLELVPAEAEGRLTGRGANGVVGNAG